MIFDAELVVKCNEIIKSNSTKAKVQIKDEVFFATASFPTKITLSMRIRAIAKDCECKCESCGTIHGNPDKTFCSSSCYDTTRKQNAPKTDYEKVVKNTIRLGERKFKNKVEGIDYLVCQICKAKSGDLGSHVRMHGITPAEYKVKYNISALKPQQNRDNRKGKNNPAYQHGGKYSKWSEHFIHGYNEQAHVIAKQNHSKFMKESVDTKFKLEYWITLTGSEEEGKKLYKKSQTKNLEWFIEKYGDVEGPVRHLAKTEKWMKSLAAKSPEEKARINSLKAASIGNRSHAEKEIEERLIQEGFTVKHQHTIENNSGSWYSYDLLINNSVIIEYNGDYWHCNPRTFNRDYFNTRTKKFAHELWEKDENKKQVAIAAGFRFMTVWEYDYKRDKQKVIQECLNFLKR